MICAVSRLSKDCFNSIYSLTSAVKSVTISQLHYSNTAHLTERFGRTDRERRVWIWRLMESHCEPGTQPTSHTLTECVCTWVWAHGLKSPSMHYSREIQADCQVAVIASFNRVSDTHHHQIVIRFVNIPNCYKQILTIQVYNSNLQLL